MKKNVFWDVANSDPHATLSFDQLHSYDSGLFSDHLFDETQKHIKALGRAAVVKVDRQFVNFVSQCDVSWQFLTRMSQLPRWRNLNHFDQITNTTFADRSKYEDIGKVFIEYIIG